MRTRNNESSLPPTGRVKRGKAVVVGFGLDDAGGHVRYTRGEAYELYGGSEDSHRELQRRAGIIRDEMARQGISPEGMTYDQYLALQAIVERVNCE